MKEEPAELIFVKPVKVMAGRHRLYAKWENVNVRVPKEFDPNDVTREMALDYIADYDSKRPSQKAQGRGQEEEETSFAKTQPIAENEPAAKKKAPAKKP